MVYDQYVDIELEWKNIFDNHDYLRNYYQVPLFKLIEKKEYEYEYENKYNNENEHPIENKDKEKTKKKETLRSEEKKVGKKYKSNHGIRFKSKICMTFATLIGYIIVSFLLIIHFI
jgi:hypothetical protein